MTNLTHLVTHITLDMCGDTRKYLVSAKQGDKATRYIAAKLLNNGEEYIIPEDAKVVANMQKPDGKHVYNTCTYQDSEVLVELTNQMLAAAGTAYCDIEIRTEDDSQVITSVSFTIEIEKSIRNEKAILSSNEFTELDRRFKDIQDTEEIVKKAEEERVSAENERASAEAGRDIAEGVRQGQEIARQESTEQALQDVQDAIEAAQKATEECNDSILVIEEINATVDGNMGIPSVTVNTEGSNSNKKFNFEFKNLKGETGQRGSQWYSGTTITGTDTTATIFSGSGITDAVINDYYLNTSTGCVYRCTEPGIATVAKWVYEGTLTNASATKWANARNINGLLVDGSANRVNYGVCSTASGTAAKTVSCTGFQLITGAEIAVKFNNNINPSTFQNTTLNVNGTGAKQMKYRGSSYLPSNAVIAGTHIFRYDGTYWNIVGDLNSDTNTHPIWYDYCDFDDCTETGFYTLSLEDTTNDEILNAPVSGYSQWGCITICSSLDSDELTQLAFVIDDGDSYPSLYIRRKYDDTDDNNGWVWSQWYSLDCRTINQSMYADKSKYGDSVVSVGRKADTYIGARSFAFGDNVTASRDDSHAEGSNTIAEGYKSHAEGDRASTTAAAAHAEGTATIASGTSAHSEGNGTKASGSNSHTEGYTTTASNFGSHSSGKYNKAMTNGGASNTQVGDVFVIGNGSFVSVGNYNLSNALRVTYTGEVYGTQAFKSSGADYAEHIKEWADGNLDNEDRVGYMVTIRDGLLHKANEGDYIAGITSGNPSVVGNADEDYYWKYERDEFNRIIMEDAPEIIQQTDGKGNPMFDEETHEPIMVETGKIIPNARMKLADGYDSSLQKDYIERKDRKEWDYVGMVGVIPVRDDGTCLPDHYCKCGQDGIATLATERGFDTFYVIERISANVVSVELR